MYTRLTIMTTLFLVACNSDQAGKEPTSPALSVAAPGFKTFDTIINFPGYWVNESYVNSVKETRSPVKAYIPENSCIWIPGRTLEPTGMIYGFHEGGEGLVVVRKDNQYELWDETLENKRYNISLIEKKLQIGKDSFVQLKYASDPASENQPAILEELLFAGHYLSEDGSDVEFTADGAVKGLENFKTYSAFIDYVAETNPVDRMALGETKLSEKYFGFQFNKDTLLIFTLKCADDDSNNNCMEETLGELKYRLTKRK